MFSTRLDDREYLRKQQYATATNLQARTALHKRFKTNPYDWFLWAFDRFLALNRREFLEVGCGPGDLWQMNAHRIPAEWQVTLTDLSEGMVKKSNMSVPPGRQFHFTVADAQGLPFPAETFEVVIADHMLYHMRNMANALGDLRRVLKPGGCLCAATNGRIHLSEIDDLIARFDPALGNTHKELSFTLENGTDILKQWFSQVSLERYPDGLIITEAEPLAAYICSMIGMAVPQMKREQLIEFINQELAQQGAFHVSKDVGLFIACR